MSINSEKPIIVKRSNQPLKPQRRSHLVQESVTEPPVEQPQIEQPEQPEPELYLESLAEPPRDESVYGSGWSIAQLMNEFGRR